MAGDGKEKDSWDKAAIVLAPVGGLLTALAVAGLGFFGSQFLSDRQSEDTKARFVSELVSKREEADSALRKDMFVSIISSFLSPKGTASTEDTLLKLELLAYNFHESLNLKPLFLQLERDIRAEREPARQEHMERLTKVARDVTRKEMVVLEDAGKWFDRTIDFDDLARSPGGLALEHAQLTLDRIDRDVTLIVKGVDAFRKELQVRLEVKSRKEATGEPLVDYAEFRVGYYDFPMIDHVRLSNDQRCAVVLKNFGGGVARVEVVCFPGAYASLKEKPYVQEMVENLMNKGSGGKSTRR
ncbi:MAG TPA: hypothetical protein VIU29_03770 [Candidatus Deferrimicrobiaceae bacterium]